MAKFLSAFILMTGMIFALPQAQAQSAPEASQKTEKKKPAKKKKKAVKKKAASQKAELSSDKEDEKVDTTGHASTHYSCEHGNHLTILRQASDDKKITVRWRDRLHSLFRVNTTTGADRFEGPRSGLVWIGIPAKGMLLDGHKGQPLANECKDARQLRLST